MLLNLRREEATGRGNGSNGSSFYFRQTVALQNQIARLDCKL
jgi:hypothetical protein